MKKLLSVAAIVVGSILAFSQTPEKMSYQAVIRNTGGTLLQNQSIAVRASILQGSANGTVVYAERLTGTTNANGLLTAEIGSGTVISGNFSGINWSSGNYYLKTETDPSGGTSYTIVGTSQLLSVPYAMYAKTSGSGGTAFSLPYSGTSSGDHVVPFRVTNTSGTLNSAGYFENTNSTNTSPALMGINNSSGGFGMGIMGRANSNTNGKMASAIFGSLQGTGDSGAGVYGYASNAYGVYGITDNGYGIVGYASGTGTGGFFFSTTSAKALQSNGAIKFTGIGEGAGKVLTSDALGNATWQNLPTTPISLWTSTGTHLYNSNTGNVGIGTSSPSEKLEVNGKLKTTTLQITNGAVAGRVLTSDGSGNASWTLLSSAAFLAKKTTPQSISTGGLPVDIVFSDVTKDAEGSFASNKMTVPKSGFYQLNINLSLANNTGVAFNNYLRVSVCKFTSGGSSSFVQSFYVTGNGSTSSILPSVSFSPILFLNTNDIIGLRIENYSTTNVIIDGTSATGSIYSSFSGFLIK